MDTKPGLSPEMLRIVRTSLSLLYVVGLAIVLDKDALTALHLDQYAAVLRVVFAALAGKELFPRTGDVSPTKLQLEVERAASMRPPPIVLVNTTEPPPSASER